MKRNIKKIITIIFMITTNFIINVSFSQGDGGGLFWYWPEPDWWEYQWWLLWWWGMNFLGGGSIYNHDIWNAIGNVEPENWDNNTSILHVWSKRVFGQGGISGIVWSDELIDYYESALTKILTTIQNVVNFILWLLWVIAVIYLLIHWFIILTAGDDDSKTKKWLKWVKNAFVAIVWIWLSWIMISFILWLINTFTS